MKFLQQDPSNENRWRAIILFGRNTATFKFGLGEALLALAGSSQDLVRLDELAEPYAAAVCRHLRVAPKQITTRAGQFLTACAKWNSGEMTDEHLREATLRHGFNDVLDAFHNIGGDLGVAFFVDERRESKGVRLTEDLLRLAADHQADDLAREVEARWRLVETAWQLGLSSRLVSYDGLGGTFSAELHSRRTTITSARDALNGYQKGHCFYCFGAISVDPRSAELADVDHFLPHVVGPLIQRNLDAVWNLVLACRHCNRGVDGKRDRIPSTKIVGRLHTRNEFLIGSHHPLRETLMLQTGATPRERAAFLQSSYDDALAYRVARWEPEQRAEAAF